MCNNPIGVFDSGIGGLNVLYKCAEILPDERFIYLADTANMPYGDKSPQEIKQAAINCAETLISMNCKAIAVACNTATATAIDEIRTLCGDRPVIGLEPAVKPCIKELGKNGYAIALVTEATYQSEKFKRLINSSGGRVIAVAAPTLAKSIEDNIKDLNAISQNVNDILKEYRTAEAIILGCSHYAYISDIINDFYGGKVKIYDGADGAARRLKYCLGIAGTLAKSRDLSSPKIVFYSTSGLTCQKIKTLR